jgi:hypothetical protein
MPLSLHGWDTRVEVAVSLGGRMAGPRVSSHATQSIASVGPHNVASASQP